MSSAYRLAEDERHDVFPLTAFLSSLAEFGIRPGLRDYDRISRVLSAGGRWDLPRLRHVLTALLAQNPEQQEALQRRFDLFFEPSLAATVELDVQRALAELRLLRQQPAPAKPEPGAEPVQRITAAPRTVAKRFAWTAWLPLLVYLPLLLGVVVWLRSDAPPPVIEVKPPTPVVGPDRPGPAETGGQRYYPDAPFIRDHRPLLDPNAARWRQPATVAALLLLGALGYGVWLRRARRPPQDRAPVWDETRLRLFDPGAIGGRPEPRLDRETLDHLADSLGYFQSEQPGRALDVAASIAASLDRGLPTPVLQRLRQVRRVLILEDAYAESLAWNPIAVELADGLQRRGVPVLRGRFEGAPDRCHDLDGRPLYLDELEDQRRGYLLLLFSDGKGLRPERDRFVLEALARWPRVAWLELREPRLWDAGSDLPARLGIPVYPASRDGLIQMMGRFMSEYGSREQRAVAPVAWRGAPEPVSDSPLLSLQLEQLLGDALPWAQSCAMMLPPVSPGLADALRRRFHPDLPPERLERLQTLPGVSRNAAGLRFAPPLLAALRQGFLARRDEAAQRRVLQFLLEQIERAEPEDRDSPAHLAWEWRRERVRLDLDPDRALQRLAELARGPLGESIRGELRRAALPDSPADGSPAAIPLRLRPRTRDGLKRLLALAPDSGVAVTEAYPSVKVHRAALSVLALSGVATLSYAGWLYLQPGPDLLLALEPEAAEHMQARLGRVEEGVWRPAELAADGRGWRAPAATGYRLALVHRNQPVVLPLEPLTHSETVALGEGAARPCLESLPEFGLTVARCPSLAVAPKEAVTLPGWRQRLGTQAPADRLLSVAVEIRLDDAAYPGLHSLTDSLLASASVDWLYRITPAAGTLSLQPALARIREELAPWQGRIQLLWWVAGKEAERLALPELPALGRTVLLGKGGSDQWADAVVKLLRSRPPRPLSERDVVAVLAAGRAEGVGAPVVLAAGFEEKPVAVAAVPEPEMVELPAGEFLMGSPDKEEGRYSDERQHRVTIERPFAIGKYEVTVGEFRRFVDATGYRTDAEKSDGCYGWTGKEWKKDARYSWGALGFEQTDQHPVACVSWNDAVAYADWLSQQTGRRYRLPTEAEWEYAARAGTQTAYYWGGGADIGCAYANGADLTAKRQFSDWTVMNCQDGYVFTAPVGQFKANAFGLHDMLGNVWEWTCSEYKEGYDGGEQKCSSSNNRAGVPRALRGGSWFSNPRYLRAAHRDRLAPDNRYTNLGLRLARDL